MGTGEQRFTFRDGLLLAEGTALATALVMPITPPKTGSGRGPAQPVIPDTTYLQDVCVYFVMTNVMILILGTILFLLVRFRG